MVPWLKPLTIPSCPKINHRYGLYRDHYFEQIFKKCGTPCKCSPTWVPPAAFDNVACLLVGWCLLSSLNQTVEREIEGEKLCVKSSNPRVESEVRTKQHIQKTSEHHKTGLPWYHNFDIIILNLKSSSHWGPQSEGWHHEIRMPKTYIWTTNKFRISWKTFLWTLYWYL